MHLLTIWSHLILLQLDPARFYKLASFNLARVDCCYLSKTYLPSLSNAHFIAMYGIIVLKLKTLLVEITVLLTSILFLSV